MQLSHEDISDLKRIVLDEDTDPFNLIRAFLFQFINNHSDLSIKSVVFKPNPAEETSANASSSTSVAGLDEDELLNGPHGNYQNVFAQDYLAFLVTQPADWFTALPHLESLGMNQAQLLDKAKRLSDYGVTKARITGGKSRNPLDQFKFNCLEYCSSYYADLDQKGELSSTNPLGKKRRLAICISKLTELTYTLALFNCHFRTLLEGQNLVSQMERKPYLRTPRIIENLALHLTPRSRKLASPSKTANALEAFSGDIEANINNMLLLYTEIYLDKESYAVYHDLSQKPPEAEDPTYIGELPLTFWENTNGLTTSLTTVIQQLTLFVEDQDLNFNSRNSIQFIIDKLLQLDLHINQSRIPFTRIFKKIFPSAFENAKDSKIPTIPLPSTPPQSPIQSSNSVIPAASISSSLATLSSPMPPKDLTSAQPSEAFALKPPQKREPSPVSSLRQQVSAAMARPNSTAESASEGSLAPKGLSTVQAAPIPTGKSAAQTPPTPSDAGLEKEKCSIQ